MSIKKLNPRINHKYKFIFTHIPKTAGNSIGNALLSLQHEKYNDGFPNFRIDKHAKAAQIKKIVGENIWNNYFTFSFVRNPWDLMVSSYHWWLHSGHRFKKAKTDAKKVKKLGSFKNFMLSDYGRFYINEQEGNLWDWISFNNEIILDYIGKFETLEKDWALICRKIGMYHIQLPHINRSNREQYKNYYDDKSYSIVENRFKKSINHFGYKF